MLKYTLIPEGYFSQNAARDLLSKVVILEKTDAVKSLELPCYKAVLLYAGDDAAARGLAAMLAATAALGCYNKVVVRLGGEWVDIVVAAGDRLCSAIPIRPPTKSRRSISCSPPSVSSRSIPK